MKWLKNTLRKWLGVDEDSIDLLQIHANTLEKSYEALALKLRQFDMHIYTGSEMAKVDKVSQEVVNFKTELTAITEEQKQLWRDFAVLSNKFADLKAGEPITSALRELARALSRDI